MINDYNSRFIKTQFCFYNFRTLPIKILIFEYGKNTRVKNHLETFGKN
jgi:hypothetical protein